MRCQGGREKNDPVCPWSNISVVDFTGEGPQRRSEPVGCHLYQYHQHRPYGRRRMNSYLKFLHELAAASGTTNGEGGGEEGAASSSTNLFSTAVISGSSSAPELKEMHPQPAVDGTGKGFCSTFLVHDFLFFGLSMSEIQFFPLSPAQVTMPGIRPLETLHNALSLRQLDGFLARVTGASSRGSAAGADGSSPTPPGSRTTTTAAATAAAVTDAAAAAVRSADAALDAARRALTSRDSSKNF